MNSRCRLCGSPADVTFVDLGATPPCESYLSAEQLEQPEVTYPLHVRICPECLLVQLPAYVDATDIFSHYAYFSSYSQSWVDHARRYVDEMVQRLDLDGSSLVIEVASNDGYLLQHLVARDVPVLGIEPAANVAEAARARGIRTEVEFLGERTGRQLANRYGRADLLVANNVLAHVPDLVDFVRGLRELIANDGLISLEFPHLMRLVENTQFDTIYHEHFSYFSLLTASQALRAGDLTVVDVEELATHGGSLRVLARPGTPAISEDAARRIDGLLTREAVAGLHTVEGHAGFASEVARVKRDLLSFLIEAAGTGRSVVGYGAPGKGNTLLNHCGIRSDLLAYTVDRNPFKHGKFLPGTRIAVRPPEHLAETRPHYIIVLPWNLREEITEQLAYTRQWDARLVVPIPKLEVF